MKISVIIVTYNGEQWLSACLNSIFASTVSVNVVVVDNFSSDNTCKIIKQFPDVNLITLNENTGFGHANNVGISYALKQNIDYVFLLNQDAYLEETTLEELTGVHQKNTDYGIISPIHLNGTGLGLDHNFSNYMLKNKALLFDALKNTYLKAIYDVPFVNAAGWLIPKKILETVGGFDPIFHHYGEDVNYCQRLLFHGFKIGVVPNVYMRHDREERAKTDLLSIEEKLNGAERAFKVKWANINKDSEIDIEQHKAQLKKNIIKMGLQLKIKSLDYYKRELAMVKRIEEEIKTSRELNKKQGMSYFNLPHS